MCPLSKKDKTRQAFAARFRQALSELGYSPNEAKRMRQLFGVSGQAVQKWADGVSLPTSARIPEIAEILGVRRAWLQDGEEPQRCSVAIAEQGENYNDSQSNLVLSTNEAKLLAQYRLLTKTQQKVIADLLLELSKSH